MSDSAAARYVMGHNDRERRRLALQASILNPFTEHLLIRAGIAEGMSVLDIGCGVGDVSLLSARIVGRQGHVTSLDIDPKALATVDQRAAEEELDNLSTVHGSVQDFQPDRTYDAVVGRHILIHTPNPLSILQNAHRILHDGGLAVFHEYDFSLNHRSYPPCPFRDRVHDLFKHIFDRVTSANTGTQLFYLLNVAGFAHPNCRVEYPMDGGPDSLFYEWFAESVIAIWPRLESLGLLDGVDIDPETLRHKLRDEAVSAGACFAGPPMIGAFARKH